MVRVVANLQPAVCVRTQAKTNMSNADFQGGRSNLKDLCNGIFLPTILVLLYTKSHSKYEEAMLVLPSKIRLYLLTACITVYINCEIIIVHNCYLKIEESFFITA